MAARSKAGASLRSSVKSESVGKVKPRPCWHSTPPQRRAWITPGKVATRTQKHQRGATSSGIMDFILAQDVASLNVLFLQLLGCQAIVACCQASLHWATLADRRFCRFLDDRRGAPYAPLHRIATAVVEAVHLGREGRGSPEDCVRVFTACSKAEVLTCTYSNLLGLSFVLDWGGGISPCFHFRKVRFRQCSLNPSDVIQFLACTPYLESAVFIGESLGGLEEVFQHRLQPVGLQLQSVEFTDCGLTGSDVACVLKRLPRLRSMHFQAMNLSGLRTPPLPNLEEARLLDCGLQRADVLTLMGHCPNLTTLALCGNPLGDDSSCDWPVMANLRSADFRHCELTIEDEEALLAKFPKNAQVESRVRLLRMEASGPNQPNQHLVFDSSSSEE